MTYVENVKNLKIRIGGEFVSFAGVSLVNDSSDTFDFIFGNGDVVKCTLDHEFSTPYGISKISIGDMVYTDDGLTMLVDIKEANNTAVYDVIEAGEKHIFSIGKTGIVSSNCSFVTDDETLIEPMCLSRLRCAEPAYYTQNVRWYCEPQANTTYLVALDPAQGTGGDYSAIQVFALPDLVQVAEWQHNQTDVKGQIRVLLQILYTLHEEIAELPDQYGDPEIYWTFENNSIGEATLQIIEDTGIERFPGTIINERRKRGVKRRFRRGLATTKSSKLSSCVRLKSLVESDRLIINSNQTLKELKTYVRKGESYGGKSGTNDDLVASLLLIVRMVDIIIAMGLENSPELRETISDDEIWGPAAVVV